MAKPDIPCSACGKLIHTGSTSLPAAQRICRSCRGTRRDAAPSRHESKRGRTCATCGATFDATGTTQRYCSSTCRPKKRSRSGYHLRKRTCEICTLTYQPTYGAQRTCGRVCGEVLRRRVAGLPPEPKPKPPPAPLRTFACSMCGTQVETTSSTRKICGSRRCTHERIRLYMNANYERYKDRIIEQAHRRRTQVKAQFVEDVSLAVLYERDRGRCGICRRKVPALGSTKDKRDPRMASIDHIVPISEHGEHSYANTRLVHYRCNLMRNNGGGNEQLTLIG